jgi:CheY-like chemotaxis protein
VANEACKVLVVDDHHDAADTTVMLLQMWGHEAAAAYTAFQCAEMAKDFDPDVVLMDLGMPRRDGFALKREVEQICPGVRVLALTGYTRADLVRRTRAEGFAAHLTKPVSPLPT